MAERYLNSVTFTLMTYRGHPLIDDLTEVASLSINIGATIDVDQLTDEITEVMAGGPHLLEQNYRQFAWGASGAGLDLILQVPNTIVSALLIWDTIVRKLRERGSVRAPKAGTTAKSVATWAAECLKISEASIRIVGFEPIEHGHRVILETPEGSFAVETDVSAGITRLEPIPERPDDGPAISS